MEDLSNEVILASCAMQQLPKIFLALNNMARRSRQQMQRKGLILGGLPLNAILSEDEAPPQNHVQHGILKIPKRNPTLSQLSIYNEVWKTYCFSYSSSEALESISWNNDVRKGNPWSVVPSSHCQSFGSGSFRTKPLCNERIQEEVYQNEGTTFGGVLPLQLLLQPSIPGILLCRIKGTQITPEENTILGHLHYLKMLYNVPMHKLLRGRPTEFILPLPRRVRGVCPTNVKSLVSLQCVRDLPSKNNDNKSKWHNVLRNYNSNKHFEYGDDPTLVSLVKAKRSGKYGRGYLGTAIPKGAAFLTYPDSMDETSFEDTIGGRNLISWEKGTKFPQQGVDQSHSFRSRRELSRQNMIQNRLRAAKFQRRMACTVEIQNTKRSPFWYTSTIRRFIPKVLLKKDPSTAPPPRAFNTWFKLRKSLRFFTNRNLVSSTSSGRQVDPEVVRCPTADDLALRLIQRRKAAEKAERRKRLKLRALTVLKYATCGIYPYVVTGECAGCKKKRRISTSDSRENNSLNESIAGIAVPLESELLPPPQLSEPISNSVK